MSPTQCKQTLSDALHSVPNKDANKQANKQMSVKLQQH